MSKQADDTKAAGKSMSSAKAAAVVLADYGMQGAAIEPVVIGNINDTFLVTTDTRQVILQRLNPIFGAEIHHDIEAVTKHLEAQGLSTPRLVRTSAGALWTEDPFGGVWRVFTLMAGVIHSRAATPALCRSAGLLLARFHRTVADLDHSFHDTRPGVHDTVRHFAHLREVLSAHRDHRAFTDTEKVGREILALAGDVPPLTSLPGRIVHGDPKLNNIVFSKEGEALCLIDLDTLSQMSIPVELGDAFRSWCNPTGEDEPGARFDLSCFEAGLEGYAQQGRGFITSAEVLAVVPAVETITLELAARFCADALDESYFGWNAETFPDASAHNLRRAQVQLSLAQSFGSQRARAEEIVERMFS